jgi:Carboxypeptidase regulatory-like domain
VKSLRTVAFVLSGLFLTAISLPAAHNFGKLAGVVVDPAGNPQMGASVWLTPEFAGGRAIELLTDANGIFVGQRLRPGLYSVKVTLAGFMPSIQDHVNIGANANASLHIELSTIFASLDQLRRKSSKSSEPDDWKWVLRSASSSRPVLQLRDGTVVIANNSEDGKVGEPRASVELNNGSVRPGSSSARPGYMGTAVSYDQALGSAGKLLIAGEVNYDESVPGVLGGSVASIWLPSGKFGEGPETTFTVRQIRVGESYRSIRAMRLEHSEQAVLTEHVVLEYGGEYLAGGFIGSETSALRPHARLGVRILPRWDAAFLVETDPDAYGMRTQDSSDNRAIDALQTGPNLVWGGHNPILDGGWHEEFAVRHDVGSRGQFETAVFRDDSRHQAVYGSVTRSADSVLLPSQLGGPLAYDAGAAGFWGSRLVYREKLANNLEVAAIYAWAGALAPDANESATATDLQQILQTRYRHSVAARVAGKLPKSKTQLAASYKWIDGTVVTRQDLYNEAAMAIDPNLSLSIRQPLPSFLMAGHWEALADFRNMLSQGYTSLETPDGHMVVMPVERSFRGGVSFQF